MSRMYHLYGMGNALVDMEFKVSDQVLCRLGIDKGHMTLIDLARQGDILQALTQEQVKACGGSAANTLIAAGQFGARTFYSFRVGGDEAGRFYLDNLKRHRVDCLERAGEGVTGTCLVMVTPDAQRSLNTFLGASADYSCGEIVLPALQESEYFYIEGYLVASPSAHRAVLKSRQLADEYGVKTVLTFSDVNMVKHFRSEMREVMEGGIHLLFANEEEILVFTGKEDLADAMLEVQPWVEVVVVTRGPRGAVISCGAEFWQVAGPQVRAVDTNGAGDMFAGAFLAALAQGSDLSGAGQFACLCAGHLVQKWGPRLSGSEVAVVKGQAKSLT